MKNLLKVMAFNTFIPFFYPFLMFFIRPWRKKAIAHLDLKPQDRVIVPGVGSGHDLVMLPKGVSVVGVDISDVMMGIAKAKVALYGLGKTVTIMKMDGEHLEFPDGSFDTAILSLYLTVVFDPKKAFAEVVRVVKPGGKILVYDHLLRKGGMPSFITKPLDMVLSFSFASVTRVLEDITENQAVSLEKVMPGDALNFIKAFFFVKAR